MDLIENNLLGDGIHLLNHDKLNCVSICDYIDTINFNLNKFNDTVLWLNTTVGKNNWYYDDMKFYFENNMHLTMFKLVMLHDS